SSILFPYTTLFVIYWATVSYITPPVALASFAASSIAKTPPMRTALTAMRLGSVKYLVPFAFVFNPALVGQEASIIEIGLTFIFAAIAVYVIACALEGWVIFINRRPTLPVRVALIIAGLLIFAPGVMFTAIGLFIGAFATVVTRFWNRSELKTT